MARAHDSQGARRSHDRWSLIAVCASIDRSSVDARNTDNNAVGTVITRHQAELAASSLVIISSHIRSNCSRSPSLAASSFSNLARRLLYCSCASRCFIIREETATYASTGQHHQVAPTWIPKNLLFSFRNSSNRRFVSPYLPSTSASRASLAIASATSFSRCCDDASGDNKLYI